MPHTPASWTSPPARLRSNDPIGDFINATSADVMTFGAGNTYESLLKNTAQLSDLAAFPILSTRMAQVGFQLLKIVYRGCAPRHSHTPVQGAGSGRPLFSTTRTREAPRHVYVCARVCICTCALMGMHVVCALMGYACGVCVPRRLGLDLT